MAKTPTVKAVPDLKAGVKTSEFWMTVVTSALALLAAFGVLGPDWARMHEQAVQAMAFLVGAGAPAIYGLSRAITKKAHQDAVATVVAKAVRPDTVTVLPAPAATQVTRDTRSL